MDQELIDKIKKLAEQVSRSQIKSDAKTPLLELEALYSHHAPLLNPYAKEKFSELIIYAKKASGGVQKKDHWINICESAFGKFSRAVCKEAS